MDHHTFYRKNFADNKLQIVCDCGWSSECEDHEDGRRIANEHRIASATAADFEKKFEEAEKLRVDAKAALFMGMDLGKEPAKPHGLPTSKPAEFDELAVARFGRTDKPQGLNPLTALDACKAWIADLPEDERPEHIIVFTGKTQENGASGTRFFQAGDYGAHAQFGMIMSGLFMIHES